MISACAAPRITQQATLAVATSTSARATGQPVTVIALAPTATATSTEPKRQTQTPAPSPTAISTPDPQSLSAQATQAAIGALCQSYERFAVSPSGLWTAVTCYSTGDQAPITFARVASQDHSQIWDVEYELGTSQTYGNVWPAHWSQDNNYLYLVEMSEWDGCCTYFWQAEQLVRLNLSNGYVSYVLRASEFQSRSVYAFEFSQTDRWLAYISNSTSPLAIKIVDMQSGLVESFELKNGLDQAGDFLWSRDELRIIFSYAARVGGGDDFRFGIGLLELQTKRQRTYETPADGVFSASEWRDDNSVVFTVRGQADSRWRLNTETGEWTQLDNE